MNTLETHVLNTIGEDADDPDVFLDTTAGMAQIRDSLNDAIEEISMVQGNHKRKMTIPLEENMNFYQIDLNRDVFAWITDVWLMTVKRRLAQKDLYWLTSFNPRWLQNTGSPERYCQIGKDIICIHPAPAASTDLLEVNMVVIPDRYTLDTDRIKLRDSFKWAAVEYATGEYWASRGDAKTALKHHTKYLEHLGVQALYPETYEKPWYLQTEKQGEPTK